MASKTESDFSKAVAGSRRVGAWVLRSTIGSVSWSPPPWLSWLGRSLAGLVAVISGWRRKRPGVFWWSLAAIIWIALGSYQGWKYYQSLPKPARLSLHSIAPAATKLEKDAKPDNLFLEFSGSAARLEQVGKPVGQGITLSPQLKGEWKWETDARLSFTPQEDWAVGQTYTVTFSKDLFPPHVLLESYQHSFASASFGLSRGTAEFYTDPQDPKIKKALFKLSATHPIDEANLKARIRLLKKVKRNEQYVLTEETVPFTLAFDEFEGVAYVHSEPLPVPLEGYYLVMTAARGVRSARGGEGTLSAITTEVRIPGSYEYFRIESAEASFVRNTRYEPEQVLIIQTSTEARQEDLAKNLTVYLLPKDRPAWQDRPIQPDYRWSLNEIGNEVLALAPQVVLTPIPSERENTTLHSFKYRAEPNRRLFVRIQRGLKAYGDYVLAKTFEAVVEVPEMPKELTILHQGSILSLTGKRTVSVLARDIEAVKFEVGRVLPHQINHLVSQTYGDFQDPRFCNSWRFSEDNLTDRFEEVRELQALEKGKPQYLAFDFSPYVRSAPREELRGLFFLKVSSWDVKEKQATGAEDKRFILITDLGVVVKTTFSGALDVFAVSLRSGTPVGDAQVEILGKNGLPVASSATDVAGHVLLPAVRSFEREKTPTVFLVRKQDDLAFLPYDRDDRVLNFSRFPIGGRHSEESPDALRAYLFSDRGIYRPGDTFHVGLIVKPPAWGKNISGIPLKVSIHDPRGLTLAEKKIVLPASGFEEVAYTTRETSPTGTYGISVYVLGEAERCERQLGATTVRVEEFLPDRLRINARLSKTSAGGWVTPPDLKGVVTLHNLFGTPAINHLVTGKIQLLPWAPGFLAYPDYQFFDPLKAEHVYTESVSEVRTDEQGTAELDLDLKRFEEATYRLTFLAEGYEAEGGRAVSAQASVLVSPNPFLIGFKPDGDLGYLSRDSRRSVHLIAIGPDLAMTASEGLSADLVEHRYVSVLTKQESGLFKYESVEKEIPVTKGPLAIPTQGLSYPLPTTEPGDFSLIIRNAQNKELSRIRFSVVGAGNLTRSLERNAELQVKLNKNDYAPGEEIEMEIRAPYTGAGLITIEQDKVYGFKWFVSTATNTVQTIPVPQDLEGNAYVNVSFVRALDSPEIYMSPLSYGVMPFSVSRERRTNTISLTAPQQARPGEPCVIRYKTERPGKIVVYAVDEGILQVARYKTPSPLDFFFDKKALEVATAQILDLLLPEFDLLQSLSASGGDAEGALGANLNPFKRKRHKPVAYWSGLIDADRTEREVVFDLPDYFNGTVRVMAVAVAQESLGVAEQKTVVRGHFVISPNVPTFLAPGDECVVSVSLANNVEGSGKNAKVTLEIVTSEHLEVAGTKTLTFEVAEGCEQTVRYLVRAKPLLGSAGLTFKASLGDRTGTYSLDLSVRPPAPYITTVRSGTLKKDTITVSRARPHLYAEYRTLQASASLFPIGLARGLIHYLEKFPYGCTEQVVSQAFPALILHRHPEFGFSQEKAAATLENCISLLRSRQNFEGAFGFWVANSEVSDYQMVYAAHFLTEAKAKGYPVPPDMLAKALDYLAGACTQVPDSLADARIHAYAVYVRTRNSIVTTNELDRLLKQLRDHFPGTWEKDLTAVYVAATFKLLKKEGEAERLIGPVRMEAVRDPDYNCFYDGLLRNCQLLYILCIHFPERARTLRGSDLEHLTGPIMEGLFNTTSSAYAILAFDAYADLLAPQERALLRLDEVLPNNTHAALSLPPGPFPEANFSERAQALQFSGDQAQVLFYQVVEAGFDRELPTVPLTRKLEIQREYCDESGKPAVRARLGDKLVVHLKVRSIQEGSFRHIAVVDLLPGGFEVELDRGNGRSATYDQQADAPYAWRPEYVDLREDRVVVFGCISPEMAEYVYTVRATNQGTYQVPPPFAESMYDRSMQALGVGGSMVVEERSGN